jgi:hypothetical protein
LDAFFYSSFCRCVSWQQRVGDRRARPAAPGGKRRKKELPLPLPPPGRAVAAAGALRRGAPGGTSPRGRGKGSGRGSGGASWSARVPPTAGRPRGGDQVPASLRALAAAARAAAPPATVAALGGGLGGEGSGLAPMSAASAWAAFHPSFAAQQAQLQQLQVRPCLLPICEAVCGLQKRGHIRLGRPVAFNASRRLKPLYDKQY